MEYISTEEFLKQPIEVQTVFLDWWKPSIGDIYAYEEKDFKDYAKVECITSKNVIRLVIKYKNNKVPLLTEGQIRKFIEDKTGGKIRIIELDGTNYNIIANFKNFINVESDLLQAYWKVALEIAKGE